MNPRIVKDIRLLLPAWLLTAALMIATALLPQGSEWAVTIGIFGCLIVAASIFGGEFGHGTISQLLTQPVHRRRIWFGKMLVLVVSLGLLLVGMLSVARVSWPVTVVVVCVFCTVPFFSLVGRSTIAGVILSVPIPGIIFVVGGLLILWLLRSGTLAAPSDYEVINEQRLHFWMGAYFGIVLPVYCALLYCLGYRRFRRLEISDLNERQVRLPKSMQTFYESLIRRLFSARHPVLRALVTKELHFQHNAMLLVLIFAVLQTLAALYIKLAHPKDAESYFIVSLFIYSALIPLVIGSSAIAEEQNLGVRVWHLASPCSTRVQWLIKIAVVLFFAGLFGVCVPLLWIAVGGSIVPGWDWPDETALGLFCCGVLLLTMLAFYTSSFSRDTVRALLIAAGLCVALSFALMWLGYAVEHSSLRSGALLWPFMEYFGSPAVARVLTSAWLVIGLPVLCLFILLLLGSFKHFKTLDHSPARIWSNILLVFLPPVAFFFLLVNLAFAASKLR
jgi:ABC-2 family transporter